MADGKFTWEDALRLFNEHGFPASYLISEQARKAGVEPAEIFLSLLTCTGVSIRQLAADYFGYSFSPKTFQDFEMAMRAVELMVRKLKDGDRDVAVNYIFALDTLGMAFDSTLLEGKFDELQKQKILGSFEAIVAVLLWQISEGKTPEIRHKAENSVSILNLYRTPKYFDFVSNWAASGDLTKIAATLELINRHKFQLDSLSDDAFLNLVALSYGYSSSGSVNPTVKDVTRSLLTSRLSNRDGPAPSHSRGILEKLVLDIHVQEELRELIIAGKMLLAFLEKRDGPNPALEILKGKLAVHYGVMLALVNSEKGIVALGDGVLSQGLAKPPNRETYRTGARGVFA